MSQSAIYHISSIKEMYNYLIALIDRIKNHLITLLIQFAQIESY